MSIMEKLIFLAEGLPPIENTKAYHTKMARCAKDTANFHKKVAVAFKPSEFKSPEEHQAHIDFHNNAAKNHNLTAQKHRQIAKSA